MATTIAVLVSGGGTNLQSIINKMEAGELDIKIACVISNKKSAFGLERAKKHNIPAHFIDAKDKSDVKTKVDKTYTIIELFRPDLIRVTLLSTMNW